MSGLRSITAVVAVAAATAACSPPMEASPPPIRILMVGDVMLGRGVAPVVAGDPDGVFRDVRHVVRGADLAMANLESPLTLRPHTSGSPYRLIADPSSAALLAAAGFDVVNLANNHAGDAGPPGVTDSMDAVAEAGLRFVGAGKDRPSAGEPVILDVEGITVAVLAFDLSGAAAAGDGRPGTAVWSPTEAESAVRSVRETADVVVVSIHGGIEYLPEPDPWVAAVADSLVAWGVDVVWGHGPHVPHPVTVRSHRDRAAVVATSLGNFLFDQRGPLTGGGLVLEVLAGKDGVVAFRTGSTRHDDLRVRFTEWHLPSGDAALLRGEWWALTRRPAIASDAPHVDDFPWGTVVAASMGYVTDAGEPDLVVSFRKVPGPHPVRDGLPWIRWTDAEGRSAHLGIYRAADLAPIWVASMVPAPVAALAACDRGIAMAYSTLDDPTVVATGAATWRPHGLIAAPRLPGPGAPGCVDVDKDGAADPVLARP